MTVMKGNAFMDPEGYLELLFAENYDRLFRYCMVKLDSDKQAAADCVGDVFLLAKSRAEELAAHPDPVGFLYKAASNYARNAAKKKRRRRRKLVSLDRMLESAGFSDGFPGADAAKLIGPLSAESRSGAPPEEEDAAELRGKLLADLRYEERTIFEMYYDEALSADEIAKRLGISKDAVRMRLFRVSDKLKAAVHERFSNRD